MVNNTFKLNNFIQYKTKIHEQLMSYLKKNNYSKFCKISLKLEKKSK